MAIAFPCTLMEPIQTPVSVVVGRVDSALSSRCGGYVVFVSRWGEKPRGRANARAREAGAQRPLPGRGNPFRFVPRQTQMWSALALGQKAAGGDPRAIRVVAGQQWIGCALGGRGPERTRREGDICRSSGVLRYLKELPS